MQSLLAQYFEIQEVEANTPPAPEQAPSAMAPNMDIVVPAPPSPHPADAILPAPAAIPEATPETTPETTQALVDSLRAENARLKAQLEAQRQALNDAQSLADSDVLTPTLNRRAFLREMQRAMADCRRYGEQACLIYLDMDGFKGINDAYGHAAGDAALVYVAETLTGSVREGDSVGRIGGDEFAILLRRADLNSSRIKALKLEAELALGTFEHKGLYLKAGGSFGVRVFASQPSAEVWLSEADAAMFLVKKSAR